MQNKRKTQTIHADLLLLFTLNATFQTLQETILEQAQVNGARSGTIFIFCLHSVLFQNTNEVNTKNKKNHNYHPATTERTWTERLRNIRVHLRYLHLPSVTETRVLHHSAEIPDKAFKCLPANFINSKIQFNKLYECLAATYSMSSKWVTIARHSADVSPSRLTLQWLFSADACRR